VLYKSTIFLLTYSLSLCMFVLHITTIQLITTCGLKMTTGMNNLTVICTINERDFKTIYEAALSVHHKHMTLV